MASGSFKQLKAWQKAIFFAESVYKATTEFPDSEKFGITNQLRRAAVSISSNISEGHGRGSKAEFARFLRIAMGSCRECESLLVVSEKLGFISDSTSLQNDAEDIARMLFALIKSTENTS